MANYKAKARNRKTGQTYEVVCFDGYFGWRQYGYCINDDVLTENVFNQIYDILEEEDE